jgi:hypothetical protein
MIRLIVILFLIFLYAQPTFSQNLAAAGISEGGNAVVLFDRGKRLAIGEWWR